MDNSVRPNLRYCIIIKVKAIKEGSSATDSVTDVTDVTDVRKKKVRQRIL
ncbi:hypothetical protein [Microcoleus sp. Pol12B4]